MKKFGEYALHEFLKKLPKQYHFVVNEETIPKNVVFFSDGITGYKTLLLVGGGVLFALSLGFMVLIEGIFANRGTGFLILMSFFLLFVIVTVITLGMMLYHEGKLWLAFVKRRYKYGLFFLNQGLICRGDEKVFVFPYKDIDLALLETESEKKAKNYFIKIQYYDAEDKPYNFRIPMEAQKLKSKKILRKFEENDISTNLKDLG